MRYSKKFVLLIFPAVTFFVGVAVLFVEYWDYKKELVDIESLFKAHVDSMAALITEGVREASASTSLIYEVTEEHLATSAHLIASAENEVETEANHLILEHGVSLFITANEDGVFSGQWGNVPSEKRAEFVSWMTGNEENILVDEGPNQALGLACLWYRALNRTTGIICLDAKRLAAMRRETGIGPLLKNVIQKDVLYVALQDKEGVLAAAPPDASISKWQDDHRLKEVLADDSRSSVTRLVTNRLRPIFEGLIPFDMADESTVLLRVGIDASVLTRVQDQTTRRFMLSLFLVVGVSLITVFLAGLLWARSRYSERMEKRLADEQEKKKHWETLGQMAATVAHEVRNPLNTIAMVSQRLKNELDVKDAERPEFDEMIGLLMSECDRVGQVVTGFLDLGKPLVLDVSCVSIREAVDEAVLPMRMRAEKEGKRMEIIHRSDEIVYLDIGRFRQMLSNVIDNALDAIDDKAIDDKGQITVETSGDRDALLICVTDNGAGMSESELEDVMKPFVSFKKTGTGLGLPLVKRIAEAHGGSLRLISAPKKGTSVEIRILRNAFRT